MLTPNYGPAQPAVRNVAGNADTLELTDNGNIVSYSDAAAVTATLPSAAALPGISVGYSANLVQTGAGLLTVEAQGVADVVYGLGFAGYFNAQSHATQGQGSTVTVVLMAQDPATGARTWLMAGQAA